MLLYTNLSEFEGALFRILKDGWREQHCKMVPIYLFGLFNATTLEFLQKVFLLAELNQADMLQKKELLKSLTLQIDAMEYSVLFITICSWLYEMQDDQFTTKVVASFKQPISIRIILPCDTCAIHYVLRANNDRTTLSLGEVQLCSEELAKEFLVQMSDTFQLTNIEIETIFLVNIAETACDTYTALVKCLNKTKKLSIWSSYYNQILPIEVVRMLSDGIGKLPNQLESFHCNLLIGDEGFMAVSSCLHNVRQLTLGNANDDHLTEKGIKVLIKAILNLSGLLKTINLHLKKTLLDDEVEELLTQCKSKFSLFKRRNDITTPGTGIQINFGYN